MENNENANELEVQSDKSTFPDEPCPRKDSVTSGIISELGKLPPGAVVNLSALAQLFGRHPFSVKRAIKRGELPRPARLFGQDCWTAGAILRHFETRLTSAAKEAERMARIIRQHEP